MQQARPVTTTQIGVHEKLEALVKRYQCSRSKRPVAEHTREAFSEVLAWLDDWQGDIILDSCCGVGESTATLANRFPTARVVGLDKSAARLYKHHAYRHTSNNYQVIRADVNDFWRLAEEQGLVFTQHYLLYPNPYPKPSQVQKRWYASAVMPSLMAISNELEIRSNWLLYLEEFKYAAKCYGKEGVITDIADNEPMTPFERKYRQSAQPCYSLHFERLV